MALCGVYLVLDDGGQYGSNQHREDGYLGGDHSRTTQLVELKVVAILASAAFLTLLKK